MTKTCISCGMPLAAPEDFPNGDTDLDWCRFCAHPDGGLKSYEEALAGLTAFMAQSQGFEDIAAREAARLYLSGMPAWRDRAN